LSLFLRKLMLLPPPLLPLLHRVLPALATASVNILHSSSNHTILSSLTIYFYSEFVGLIGQWFLLRSIK
jgi:phosphate starvation-inducible membrane PsiE